MLAFKIAFAVLLVAVFIVGIVVFRNFNRWLGPDASVPSENDSARLLNKSQFVLIWLLSLKLLSMMVWIL